MKIVEARYDETNGVSTVSIRKGENIFTGEVSIAPEDIDVVSSFAGCYFAEIKAKIKLLKWQYQEVKKEYKTLQNLYDQMTQLRDWDLYKHSQPMSFLRKQLRIKATLADNLNCYVQELEETYPQVVEDRLTAARRFPEIARQKEFVKKFQAELDKLEDN